MVARDPASPIHVPVSESAVQPAPEGIRRRSKVEGRHDQLIVLATAPLTGHLGVGVLASEAQNGDVDIVPVRRDGTGRLVAIGLIAIVDIDGEDRWSTISGATSSGESFEETIERSLRETLGPDVHSQFSAPLHVKPIGWSSIGGDGSPGRQIARGESAGWAVEIAGRVAPQGQAQRFMWFLVTALPAQERITAAARSALADFLEAQGEPGLAARLGLF